MSEVNSINEREGPPVDLSGMLGKLLANPQIIQSVASALSGEGGEAAPKADTADSVREKEKAEESSPTPDVAAMAQKLPEIMNMLTPVLQQKGGARSGKDAPSDNRACLLNAMKPYMSQKRCEAIDYIIKFSQISDIIKNMN